MDHLENRVTYVTRHLARQLLSVAPGERIPTTSEIAGTLGVGFGTVEKAIVALRDNKVLKTRARGQMGTFLIERDLPLQWAAAGLGAATGLLPIPNSMLFVGLATGLTDWFDSTGIPFSLNFKNGGLLRVAALRAGRADFAVVSRHTAQMVCAEADDLTEVMQLPQGTYYAGHHIVSRAQLAKPRADWIIGVDATSFDHESFCNALFPGAVMRPVRYVNLPYAIMRGDIDATAIHSRSLVPVEVAQSLSVDPVVYGEPWLHAASATVVLCRSDNAPMRAVFNAAAPEDKATPSPAAAMIERIQKAVIGGEHEPAY